jgi:hypothetical protein
MIVIDEFFGRAHWIHNTRTKIAEQTKIGAQVCSIGDELATQFIYSSGDRRH